LPEVRPGHDLDSIDASVPDAASDSGRDGGVQDASQDASQAGGEGGPDGDTSAPDPCRGSPGDAVCEGAELHLCDESGQVSSSSPCGSEVQCQLGLESKACAPCKPGVFRCRDAVLERCADDGSRWDEAETCASPALCNATAGACTDKACTETTRVCQGDVLKGCSDDLSSPVTLDECGAGLCDQASGQCDACVANSRRCDGEVVVACDATGKAETRTSCTGSKPKCTGTKCVQCLSEADCSTAKPFCVGNSCVQCRGSNDCRADKHELCENSTCVVQPYCGDGKVTAGEECDPKASGSNEWSCNAGCRKTTSYNPCETSDQCSASEICYGTICWPTGCDARPACPQVPDASSVGPSCVSNYCILFCDSDSDCAPGHVCAAVSGFSDSVCFGCSTSFNSSPDQTVCPSGSICIPFSPGASWGTCE
jgi:hypothetical protein